MSLRKWPIVRLGDSLDNKHILILNGDSASCTSCLRAIAALSVDCEPAIEVLGVNSREQEILKMLEDMTAGMLEKEFPTGRRRG